MAIWDYEIFWKETLNQLQQELEEVEFSLWFNIHYLRSEENTIIIGVPSSFYRDQFKIRYHNLIEEKLHELSGQPITLQYEVVSKKVIDQETTFSSQTSQRPSISAKDTTSKSLNQNTLNTSIQQKDPHPLLRRDYTFSNYVIGDNNSFAANAALAISKNPGTAYNPFLVYGGVGLGKTHLMQAIGNYIHEHSNAKIIYITAETFTNEFVQALQANKTAAFKNKYRFVDVLLVDDIHFLQNKIETQEELFHTFNALYDANKQMVFTCDRPVSELKHLSDRLKSRFERGLTVDLQPPDYETRLAILKKKADARNITIPHEVLELVSKNISSNVRDLEAALTKLIAYTELVQKPITIEVAQQHLKDVFASPKQANMSIEAIQRVVAEYFSLSYNDLKGKKRTQNIVLPRQIAMYIAREITEYSTTELGLEFGGRDHTTVMHACQKIEERIRSDPTLEPIIQNLIRQIKDYRTKN
ncbi:chromosomal replication initiator protein DnaA [Gracilinema caldarium]|uniref:Chromosomal replication initiator protein DnaA n=1 Tax=Gracilinema caldarium (strain ATCC 51460 / DSM 7334 / H1) TaxID=744872 RepID=F8EWL0_GRAC1|nr:chromosomal replication initiator protein DnaA [Gracilinema caldarium]AEJ18173.1 Chromosomal replication initiator protein dnaA [Gracilinema caldarium DSM 7334]